MFSDACHGGWEAALRAHPQVIWQSSWEMLQEPQTQHLQYTAAAGYTMAPACYAFWETAEFVAVAVFRRAVRLLLLRVLP